MYKYIKNYTINMLTWFLLVVVILVLLWWMNMLPMMKEGMLPRNSLMGVPVRTLSIPIKEPPVFKGDVVLP